MTLREVLESNMNNYICIDNRYGRNIHLGGLWLAKYEAGICYNSDDLDDEVYIDDYGADDYDIYVSI